MLQIKFETQKVFKKIKLHVLTSYKEQTAKRYLNQLNNGEYKLTPTPIYVSQLANAKDENIEKYCWTNYNFLKRSMQNG